MPSSAERLPITWRIAAIVTFCSSAGIPALRKAVAEKMKRFYGIEVDPDREVTVTSGATEGLCATLLGILEPGDEIILLEPAYDSYAPICALARADIRYVFC